MGAKSSGRTISDAQPPSSKIRDVGWPDPKAFSRVGKLSVPRDTLGTLARAIGTTRIPDEGNDLEGNIWMALSEWKPYLENLLGLREGLGTLACIHTCLSLSGLRYP